MAVSWGKGSRKDFFIKKHGSEYECKIYGVRSGRIWNQCTRRRVNLGFLPCLSDRDNLCTQGAQSWTSSEREHPRKRQDYLSGPFYKNKKKK